MFDLLIRRGTVVDGTGGKPFKADVAVDKGQIAAVESIPGDATAAREIDAAGKVVCPGFIDIHSHNDFYIARDDFKSLFESYLRQGITSCVISNCGWSVAPWLPENAGLMGPALQSMGLPGDYQPHWVTQEDFHHYLEKRGLPVNFIPLAGHGPIRFAALGEEPRFATPAELEQMKNLLRESMKAGCRGFSTGLTYYPGMYAHTDEITELARVAAEYGGRYVTHVRGHCNTYDSAVKEAVAVAKNSGSSLQLSHVFCVPYLGRMASLLFYAVGMLETVNRLIPLPGWPNPVLKNALGLVDEALQQGMDVGMDFIPYVLGNTTVTQLFPPWANVGGTAGLLERLRDPVTRARIRKDVYTLIPEWPHWEETSWSDNYVKALGWRMMKILSVGSGKNSGMAGRPVVELARQAKKDPFEFLADLTLEEEGAVTFVFGLPPRPWTEKVLMCIQDHPELSIGADVIFPQKGPPPPSAYGCFPRVIEHYVRELSFYSLENAIHRMTGLSARRFRLDDRGIVRKGAAADLVVFDYKNVRAHATLEKPEQHSEGIEYVMVNGQMIIEKDRYHGDNLAGRVLALE